MKADIRIWTIITIIMLPFIDYLYNINKLSKCVREGL